MNKEIKWILVSILLLVSFYLGSQEGAQAQNAPVVIAETVMNAVPGQQVTIPITVSNFKNIGTVYLSLDYDPNKLQLVSKTINPLLGGTLNDNIIASDKHRLILGWYSTSTGKTLPDYTWIENFVFKYLSGSPTLQWAIGYSCKFTDITGKTLNDLPSSTYYIDGSVCGTLPGTVAINGANTFYQGQTDIAYSVPLDPTITYNWSYSGTGATFLGNTNAVKINFSPSATSGTLSVRASNACSVSTGTKEITMQTVVMPTFSPGPTNISIHTPGNVYTTQSGKTNYIWTVIGGTITSGGTPSDNSATIIWNTTGNQSVSVKYDDLGVSTAVATYQVTVNPAILTITGLTANKVYNGTTDVTLNTGSATLIGVYGTDVVTLNSIGAMGIFPDKNVGTNKQVTTSGFTLGGINANNYIVTSPVITGNITKTNLTITGLTANNKIYDRTPVATLNTGSARLNGVIGNDDVTLGTSAVTGTFASQNVASGIAVTTSAFSLGGVNLGNYVVNAPVLTGNITPASLTIAGITVNNKTYDGTPVATLNTGPARLNGIIGNDDVTLGTSAVTGTFASQNVASGIAVTTSAFSLGGVNLGNYVVNAPVLTGNITPASLTIAGITVNNKTYDGTPVATLNTGSARLNGIIGNDDVSLVTSAVTGLFADKNAGTGIQIITQGFKLEGTNAKNYSLINPLLIADIFKKSLKITAKDVSKCFGLLHIFQEDGFTIEGLVNNDTIKRVLLYSIGVNTTAVVGTYDITPGNVEGTGLTNYDITFVKGSLTVIPNASQPAEFLISTSTVCMGTAGVEYAVPKAPFTTYNWSYSGTGVTIHDAPNTITLDFSTMATSGILSVTASTSCGTSVARTLPITINSLKSKPVIAFIDKTLYSNVGAGIQWYQNFIPIQGATSQYYTPKENGKYFNVISNNNCNPDTSNILDLIITNTTQYMNNSIKIFPNPTKEYFILRSTVPMTEALRLSIFSSECILIKKYEITNTFTNKECMIDVRHLTSGLFFIRIDTGHQTITQKLIIL